jgi:Peptidase family C25/FlgD Ig-like domain
MSRRQTAFRALAILAFAACFVPHPTVAATYQIVSVSSSRVQVRFRLSDNEIRGIGNLQPLLFAFSSSASVSPGLTIQPDTVGRIAALPFSILSKGYAGASFLQWISYSPFVPGQNGGRSAISRGIISIDFGSPVIKTSEKPRMQNSILHMAISFGLKKTVTVQKPQLPYSIGLKMFIDKDGIYQLSYADLKRLGVPVDRIPFQYFKIFNNTAEVPLYVTNSQRAMLGSDDAVLFYAKALRGTSTYFAQFSNSNAYWLSWQTDRPGIRIADVSGAIRKDLTVYQATGPTNINAHDFLDTIHCEQDNEILSLGNVNVVQDMADSSTADTSDNWYWGSIGRNSLTNFTITIPPPTSSSDASMTAHIHIRLQGTTSDPTVSPDHRLAVYLNNDTLGLAEWDGQTPYDFISSPFPSSRLLPGANTLTFVTKSTAPSTDQSELNWVEIQYYRSFSCLDDMLSFKNSSLDTAGIYQFSIKGFSSPQVDLWDLSMHRRYTDFEITNSGGQTGKGAYTLVFQDSCTGVRRFVAQTTAMRLLPKDMVVDTMRTDWNQAASADYIIVAPDSFFTDLAPLVDVYKKKGLIVAVVDISDVYNSFSYGVRDPESIRTMLGYIMSVPSAKPPRYLLLGGDTSHDLDKTNGSRNIIPTHLSQVPGWGPAADDGYFATVVGDDNFPDLFVGRFPAENRIEMKSLVSKTVNYLTGQVTGPWHDNLLLLGGAESDFTTFNDQAVADVIGSSLNVIRLDGDPASRYYRDATVASKDIAGYMNAGLYAINFDGHGGGLVWSDSKFFSYTDFDKLYNGQWSKAGRLPLVFSFTCLTGFFESPDYRSLGEEFVRLPQNGAIGFFGASAYTSKTGNIAMNRLFLENAINGTFESVGELLWLTKINMLAQFGSEFLPLVRQYNFIGDPALPWSLPPDTMKLSLSKQTLKNGDTLSLHGICAPVTLGQAKVTVGADFNKWNDYVWSVSSGSFSGSSVLKDSLKTSRGFIHAFAWSDSNEVRGWTSFSKSNILFKSVAIVPSAPHYGDSVRIAAVIDSPDSSQQQVSALFCLCATATPSASSPSFVGVSMVRDSTGAWTTVGKIPLLFHGTVGEELFCKFREVGPGVSDTTDTYSFPILGRPDLLFTGNGPQLLFYNDSLFVHCEVLNAGTTASPPFSVSIFRDTFQSGPAFFTFTVKDSLLPAKTKQLNAFIPDTQGSLAFACVINPSAAFDEISRSNNYAQLHVTVLYRDMQDVIDSLYSEKRGLTLVPCSRFNAKHRLFLFCDTIGASQPLQTDSRWTPLGNDSVARFWIGVRPALTQPDSLSWIFRRMATDSASQKKASLSNSGKICVCQYDSLLRSWRYAPSSADSGKMICLLRGKANGPLALAQLSDTRPPQIKASVDGREVSFLDYAAKGKPFNLFFSDVSGVLPSSVRVLLNNSALDSSLLSRAAPQSDLRELSMTAYPKKECSIDSLTVLAQDLAGNAASVVFAYMPGEDLVIKEFSCHPNPFSAKQDNTNSTLQTIRFAFLLTDVAQEAKIVIYTIANRVVWTWQQTNGVIGYQEVPWDGKTSQGYRIANGTYYAKLTVKNSSKKATSIIRIAKLEGF